MAGGDEGEGSAVDDPGADFVTELVELEGGEFAELGIAGDDEDTLAQPEPNLPRADPLGATVDESGSLEITWSSTPGSTPQGAAEVSGPFTTNGTPVSGPPRALDGEPFRDPVPDIPIGRSHSPLFESAPALDDVTDMTRRDGVAGAPVIPVDDLIIDATGQAVRAPSQTEVSQGPDVPWADDDTALTPGAPAAASDYEPAVERSDSSDDITQQASGPPRGGSVIEELERSESTRRIIQRIRALEAKKGKKFGSYSLLGTIGTGGMADVRLAYEDQPDGEVRPCVVKRISRALAEREDHRAMFHEEARICRLLRHPGIIEMYDAGEFEGTPYIAFELVDGVTAGQLGRLVRPDGLPPTVVMEIGAHVASALSYAHALKAADGKPLALVHRDVSPQNILISREGSVKLGDFGIAHFEGRDLETQTGFVKGKMRYLAPEQLRMEAVDARTDIFALGVVVAELVTGTVLFPESIILSEDPSNHLREQLRKRTKVPAELVDLIVRMTADRRDGRPDHAEAVARELRRIRANTDGIGLVRFLARGIFTKLDGLEDAGHGASPNFVADLSLDDPAPRGEPGPAPSGGADVYASDDDFHYPTSIGVLFPELFGSGVGAYTGRRGSKASEGPDPGDHTASDAVPPAELGPVPEAPADAAEASDSEARRGQSTDPGPLVPASAVLASPGTGRPVLVPDEPRKTGSTKPPTVPPASVVEAPPVEASPGQRIESGVVTPRPESVPPPGESHDDPPTARTGGDPFDEAMTLNDQSGEGMVVPDAPAGPPAPEVPAPTPVPSPAPGPSGRAVIGLALVGLVVAVAVFLLVLYGTG